MVFHGGCINGHSIPARMKGVICSVKGVKSLSYYVKHDESGKFVRGSVIFPEGGKIRWDDIALPDINEELIYHCLDCDKNIPELSLAFRIRGTW